MRRAEDKVSHGALGTTKSYDSRRRRSWQCFRGKSEDNSREKSSPSLGALTMSTSWVSQPTLREMAATPSGRDASPDTRWRQASLRLLGAAAWAEEVAGKDAGVKLAVASKGGGASEKPTARVSHKFLRRHGNIGPVSIKTSWPACFCPCPCPSRCCGPSDWPPGSSPSPGGPFFSKWHNGGRIQSGSQRRNRRRGCNHKNCCRRTYEGSHVGPGREPLLPRLMDEGPMWSRDVV